MPGEARFRPGTDIGHPASLGVRADGRGHEVTAEAVDRTDAIRDPARRPRPGHRHPDLERPGDRAAEAAPQAMIGTTASGVSIRKVNA